MLGAGGVMGGAWLTGALHALASETGWDPASADRIVGTSAGSMMGGLLAAGVPPWFMVAHSSGERFEGLTGADGRPASEANRSAGAVFRLHRARPPIGPGSWSLISRSLRAPTATGRPPCSRGWLPRGLISTARCRTRSAASCRTAGPTTTGSGSSRATTPPAAASRSAATARRRAELAPAVAASCAIPGFYRPVRIDGRRYVDGGLWSTSNLDILRDEELDLVICLNPTSSLHPTLAWNPAQRLADTMRSQSGRRLGWEAKRLRASGTKVVLIQPTVADHEVMGANLMSRRNRDPVIRTAIGTVARQLHAYGTRDLLADLPARQPVQGAPPGRAAVDLAAGPAPGPGARQRRRMTSARSRPS